MEPESSFERNEEINDISGMNLKNAEEKCESVKINNIEKIDEKTENCEKSENVDDIENTVLKTNEEVEIKIIDKPESLKSITSLDFLATAYDSTDNDSEEETTKDPENLDKGCQEKEIDAGKEYRSEQKMSSSESEDSSEDSESSEEEENESEDSGKNEARNEKNRQRNQEKEMKGEFDDLPPIKELKISVPEVLCDPLGEVGWMVEQMVVVKPKPGKPTLNIDTILFVERGRRVLGRIFDVFGQVAEPHYCVRFNSSDHIKESDIRVGMMVYFCPNTEYTSVVFLQDLLKMKATEEVGDDEHPEFSDDEEERAYYATLKQRQKNEKPKNTEVPQKRQKTDTQDSSWKSNHPWSSGKRQQPKKPHKMHESHSTQQQNGGHQQNWPNPYFNNRWPMPDPSYGGNRWPNYSQPSYGYNERYNSGDGNPRNYFQPPFGSPQVPYMQNQVPRPLGNLPRFPPSNYLWEPPNPRIPDFSWPLAPPPPPPPPPGV